MGGTHAVRVVDVDLYAFLPHHFCFFVYYLVYSVHTLNRFETKKYLTYFGLNISTNSSTDFNKKRNDCLITCYVKRFNSYNTILREHFLYDVTGKSWAFIISKQI